MSEKTQRENVGKIAGVSGESVKKRTGKDWNEWFRLLDDAGAMKMKHKDIAAWLKANHMESAWWSQMVTVGYEQARGIRQKHEKPAGFEVGRSKTLPVPVSKLYGAWSDARARRRWLGETGLEVRGARANKSMRLTWSDGETIVAVTFYGKGRGKSQVTVQHTKLKDEAAGERMKRFWGEALDRLYAQLVK
jgi:uncharacterized protein YndB with AHSA1/START domain